MFLFFNTVLDHGNRSANCLLYRQLDRQSLSLCEYYNQYQCAALNIYQSSHLTAGNPESSKDFQRLGQCHSFRHSMHSKFLRPIRRLKFRSEFFRLLLRIFFCISGKTFPDKQALDQLALKPV